jgi:hypothetical protein
MRRRLFPLAGVIWLSAAWAFLVCTEAYAGAADLKIEAQLIWGTDDNTPPDGKNCRPVSPDIEKKLKDLPLKWKHYFEMHRQTASVPLNDPVHVALSDKCELVIKNVGGGNVEVSLIGKGKEVVKRSQALPKGDILALGGNAPNSTAWLAILKRIE